MYRQLRIVIILLLITNGLASAQWVKTNGPPGNDNPYQSLAAQHGNVFAGAALLLRSSDEGGHWKYLTNGPGGDRLGFPGSALYSTGSRLFQVTQFSGGVLYSDDDGATWNDVNAWLTHSYFFYVCGSGDFIAITGTTSLSDTVSYYSSNAGSTWAPIGLDVAAYVVAATKIENDLFVATTAHAYRSTNNGARWDRIDSVLSPNAFTINDLASINGSLVLAKDWELNISNDRGQTWHLAHVIDSTNWSVGAERITHIGSTLIAWCPGTGMFTSDDGGTTWTGHDFYNQGALNSCFATDGNRVYFSSDGTGIFVSNDKGNSWQSADRNLGLSNVWSVAASDTLLLATTSGAYLHKSSNAGLDWIRDTAFPYYAESMVAHGNEVVATSWYGRVLSTDGGMMWNAMAACPPGAMAFSGANFFVAITDSIAFSHDSGSTWNSIPFGYHCTIHSIGLLDSVLITDFGLRSTDAGETWHPFQIGQNNCFTFVASVNQQFYVMSCDKHCIYRSSDYGDHWIVDTIGLPPDRNTMMLATWNGYTIMSTGAGTCYERPGSSGWIRFSDDMLSFQPTVIAVQKNMLYAGTDGFGVWMRDLSSLADVETTPTLRSGRLPVLNSYPNPFQSETVIRYQVANGENASFVVRDMMGRTVATFHDGMQPAGDHEIVLSIPQLPNGMYFVEYHNGAAVHCATMIKTQ